VEEATVPVGFVLDHVFVAVDGPGAAADRLRAVGFAEGPTRDHPGQGTASRGVFFENAYLELIWLTDAEEAASELVRRTRLLERTSGGGGACPFGIALRGIEGDAPPPFATWAYRPPYVPEGTSIPVGLNSEVQREPLLFVLPWRTEAAWAPPEHRNGARRITGVRLGLEHAGGLSEELAAVVGAGLVEVRRGGAYLMDVELDHGASGAQLDLRPEIPLRIVW
jgi:hypothetical protein